MNANTQNRISQFLDRLETEIRPGHRGAPDRRELFNRIVNNRQKHVRQLDMGVGRHYDRRCSRYSAEHGFNIMIGSRRHGPSDPRREQSGRIQKIQRRVRVRVKSAPIAALLRWRKILDITRYTEPDLSRYLDSYPAALRDRRVYRGEIYQYAESTEWEKYGKKSYPRTVDRRIQIIARSGIIKTIYLDAGERMDARINKLIPPRAKKIAADKRRKLLADKRADAAAERKHRAALKQAKPAYKIVEKNGCLRSVFNPDFVYPINRWVSNTPADDHNGGIYCYGSADEAVNAAKNNDVFKSAWTAGKSLVLCECRRRGIEIFYGKKISVENLIIKKIIGSINVD